MQPRQNDEVPFSGVWAGKFPLLARTRQDRAEGLCGGGGQDGIMVNTYFILVEIILISGSCLCGAVKFTIKNQPKKFYRCHCSLCRRQSGVGHNLATIVKVEDFDWQTSKELISSWKKESGYRNDFCKKCGSTVPNILRGQPYVWLPLGLLNENIKADCCGDFCTDDSMVWDCVRSANSNKKAVSSLFDLLVMLNVEQAKLE